jgi:hypothetical protein
MSIRIDEATTIAGAIIAEMRRLRKPESGKWEKAFNHGIEAGAAIVERYLTEHAQPAEPTDGEMLDWLDRNEHLINEIEPPSAFPTPKWVIYKDSDIDDFWCGESIRDVIRAAMSAQSQEQPR